MPVHENGDTVNHPQHYNKHPSGVECIDVVRHMNFNVGNAIKYLWRAGLKETGRRRAKNSDKKIEDIKKAIWYLNDEIARLQSEQGDATIDSAVVVAATVQASPPPPLAIPDKAEEDDPPPGVIGVSEKHAFAPASRSELCNQLVMRNGFTDVCARYLDNEVHDLS